MRIHSIVVTFCAAMLLASSAFAQDILGEDSGLTPVVLQLKWQHQFQFAGYYAAKDKGFYAASGLDVELREATPGLNVTRTVVSGEADFGVGTSELLLDHMAGEPVVALAAIFQHAPNVILSMPGSGITRPHDLIGKTWMRNVDGEAEALSMIIHEGIDPNDINQIEHSFDLQDLVEGRIDAQTAYLTNEPFTLRRMGFEPNIISPRNYGVDFYGDCLFTTKAMAAQNPELVERFLEASLEGWHYAMANPAEMVELIRTEYAPGADREKLAYEYSTMRKLIVPEFVRIGHMNPGRWQFIAETYKRLDLAPEDADWSGFLYQPNRVGGAPWLQPLLVALAVSLLIALLLAILLHSFNRKLRSAVAERTERMERTNQELVEEVIERRRVEADLERRNQLLTVMQDASPDGIIIANMNREVIAWNQRFLDLWSIDECRITQSSESAAAAIREQVVNPEEHRRRTDFLFNNPETSEDYYGLTLKDGTYIVRYSRGLADRNGVYWGRIWFYRDITASHRQQQALAESEAQLRKAQHIARIGNFKHDLDGQKISYSDEMYRIFGYEPGEFEPNMAFMDAHFHPDDIALVHAAHARMAAGEAESTVEYRFVRKDGSLGYATVSARRVEPEDGPAHIVGTLQDITERKEMELALLAAKEEAERASAAKSEFLGNISHELRTPLNGVLGMLQLLENTPLEPDQLDFVRTALNSGRSLTTILNDLIDLSQIEAGVIPIIEREFRIQDVLSLVTASFAGQAEEEGLVLSTGIGDAVPEWLFGDDGRIRQILFNLVGNAIKFTPEGSIAIDIDYFDRYGPPRLYIAVKDTGVGIAPEEIEPVFRSFTQADGSLSRRHEGAGLGLAIVRRLIERMGGVIDVASTPGEGTTISVTARVRPASQPAQAPPAVAVKHATKQSLSVLVVEDNRINRLLVERFLNQLGHETIASDDGMDALDKLRENDRIDLVLMDIQMPVLDGLETTRRIRGELGLTDLPVVALTAHAMKGDREEFLQAGMDDYLAKPIQRDDLERVLQRFFPQPN